jgi:sec-independent protein translocase protein TatA
MGSMSAAHWLIVLIIVLLVFGPTRLASLGKGLGEGIRSFREGLAGDGDRAHANANANEEARAALPKDKPPAPAPDQSTPS